MKRPLSGVSIVDLSRILAGPFATQLLADLGADVAKYEPPGGDPTRQWGPPFAANGESAYFRCANRGKSSTEIDLDEPAARAGLDERLTRADVLVENFLPGSAARYGLDRERLRARFPRLIVASIRSFASDVEARDRAGYDFLMQAESGWMAITGEVGGRPMKVGVALVDVLAGLYLGNAIQAALLHRERTGESLHVEVPLFEAALAGLVNVGSSALLTGETPRRYGNSHPNIVPYQTFRCSDGEVAIAVGNDRQFATLLAALGVPSQEGWRTNPGRVAEREAVVGAIEAVTRGRDVGDVVAACRAVGVAAGPVRSAVEALRSEEGRSHRAIHRLSRLGPPGEDEMVEVVGSPILLDGERVCAPSPPPPRPAGGT
jgi:crotonobetainyl-CoA:carnitine CoA-transferase CaiB-like acyl-CoA transferase